MSMSTTFLPHFDALGVTDTLVGVDTLKWINSPTIFKMAKDGKLIEIGSGPTVNVEQVIAKKADFVASSGSGNPQYDSHPKLMEAGIKVGIIAEYMEETPLGRAEWLKFTAAFFNKEAEANKFFDDADSKYTTVSARAKAATSKPTVFTGSPYQGTWYMPGGNSFVARGLADAGAFRIHRQHAGRVALFGEGLSATWTGRALEREGYEVVCDGCEELVRVEVTGHNGSTRWRSVVNSIEEDHQSLGAVLTRLRHPSAN